MDHLEFPGYDQDVWVAAQNYQGAPWSELVDLWSLFNLQLARVIEATPKEALERSRDRHNLDQIAFRTKPRERPVTLAYFMADYVDHLIHHLEQL